MLNKVERKESKLGNGGVFIYLVSDRCKKCNACVVNCPLGAIESTQQRVAITKNCVECGICKKVCPFQAIVDKEEELLTVTCKSCPVQCKIPPNRTGACKRYTNLDGCLKRNQDLVIPSYEDKNEGSLEPIITGIGAGTSYPCSKPAPYIVSEIGRAHV